MSLAAIATDFGSGLFAGDYDHHLTKGIMLLKKDFTPFV